MLTERENALRTLTRSGEPEWIPVTQECFYNIIPDAMKERPNFGENGLDWFGCNWHFDASTFGFAQKPDRLFDDITEWRKYVKFPDLENIDWEASAKKDLEGVDRENKLVRLFVESGPFERLHHLVSFENAMAAFYEEPEATMDLLNALGDYKVKLFDILAEYYHPDAVVAHDDLGTNHGPMISLDLYREFLKPQHKKIGDCLHKHNILYLFHSDGKMEQFIPDLIECGIDILNPVQGMNNQQEIEDLYGDKISFEIVPDPIFNKASTTEETVRTEIRRVLDIFGPRKNAMIMAFSFVPGYSEIILEEIRKYGDALYGPRQ